MSEDALIYTFILNYNPKPLGSSAVVRTNQAAVIVECHYPRYVKGHYCCNVLFNMQFT